MRINTKTSPDNKIPKPYDFQAIYSSIVDSITLFSKVPTLKIDFNEYCMEIGICWNYTTIRNTTNAVNKTVHNIPKIVNPTDHNILKLNRFSNIIIYYYTKCLSMFFWLLFEHYKNKQLCNKLYIYHTTRYRKHNIISKMHNMHIYEMANIEIFLINVMEIT